MIMFIRSKMKKGQAEMLGLVVIVLILIFLLFFYVRFNRQIDESAITMRSNTRVNNMLNALMLVHVDDKEQMKDVLIEDCKFNDPANPNVCSDTIDLIKDLIGAMKEDRENYELKFENFNGINEDMIYGNRCEEGIAATPARFKKDGRTYTIKLKLC